MEQVNLKMPLIRSLTNTKPPCDLEAVRSIPGFQILRSSYSRPKFGRLQAFTYGMVSVDEDPGHGSMALIPNTRTLDFSMPLPPFLVVERQQVRGSVHHTLGNSSMMPKSQALNAARTEKSRLQGSCWQVGRAGLAPHSRRLQRRGQQNRSVCGTGVTQCCQNSRQVGSDLSRTR